MRMCECVCVCMFVCVFVCETYIIAGKKKLKPKKASFQLRINTAPCEKEILEEKSQTKRKNI